MSHGCLCLIEYNCSKWQIQNITFITRAKKHRNDATGEAEIKPCSPLQCIVWLGKEFDTVRVELRIPNCKIIATTQLLRSWNAKTQTTRKKLQKLLGKLFQIAMFVHPASWVVSRMLDTLQQIHCLWYSTLSAEFHMDVAWFLQFLPHYNSVSIIDATSEFDNCLSGCGGISGTKFYSTKLSDFILEQNHIIVYLEALSIVVGTKLFAKMWKHKAITIYSDSSVTVSMSRDRFLMKCARELWLLAAT